MRLTTKRKSQQLRDSNRVPMRGGPSHDNHLSPAQIINSRPSERLTEQTNHARLLNHPKCQASSFHVRNVQGSNPGVNSPEGGTPDVLRPKEGGQTDAEGLDNAQRMLEIEAKRVWADLSILAN